MLRVAKDAAGLLSQMAAAVCDSPDHADQIMEGRASVVIVHLSRVPHTLDMFTGVSLK